jgi:hypothetical protein
LLSELPSTTMPSVPLMASSREDDKFQRPKVPLLDAVAKIDGCAGLLWCIVFKHETWQQLSSQIKLISIINKMENLCWSI